MKKCVKNGQVALTFDDGPFIKGNTTSRILDLFEDQDVHATFFVNGNNRNKGRIDDPQTGYPAILRRMHQAGHQIANHGWSHKKMTEISADVLKMEMMWNEMALRNIFGWFPTYMRPPFLACDGSCLDFMKAWGYHVIYASLNPQDWKYGKTDETLETVKQKVRNDLSAAFEKNSYIAIAHDVDGEWTYNLAKFTIERVKELGYKIVTVGECLGDPKENWIRQAGEPISSLSLTSTPVTTPDTTPSTALGSGMSSAATITTRPPVTTQESQPLSALSQTSSCYGSGW